MSGTLAILPPMTGGILVLDRYLKAFRYLIKTGFHSPCPTSQGITRGSRDTDARALTTRVPSESDRRYCFLSPPSIADTSNSTLRSADRGGIR